MYVNTQNGPDGKLGLEGVDGLEVKTDLLFLVNLNVAGLFE